MNARLLLEKLKLDPSLFQSVKAEKMNLADSIDKHAGWLSRHIYSKGYLGQACAKGVLPREHHGILHVGRAAYHTRVFANLYRKHGDQEALALIEDDIKLIQIAALFHDSARVNDEKDDTDHESGLLLYFYLLELGVSHEKAKLLAEAVANKDVVENKYKELRVEKEQCVWIETTRPKKNIYQKIIHDADCVDIIRARDKFEARYLDFFQDIIFKDSVINNDVAFNELAWVIVEARSIIHIQGDSRSNIKHEIKVLYENDQAYLKLCADITAVDHPMLYALGKEGVLFTAGQLLAVRASVAYDKSKGFTEENLNAALAAGLIFARGVLAPSGLRDKNKSDGSEETQFRLELRKASRPQTNEARSISMLGFGGGTYSNAGLIVIAPSLQSIRGVYTKDIGSGRAKKRECLVKHTLSANDVIQRQLNDLLNELKQGGVYTPEYQATHTELLCDLSRFDAIYYNDDPCTGNLAIAESMLPHHRHAPLLQALYLQKEYEVVHKIVLPIIRYSRYHSRVVIEKSYTEQEMIKLWQEICADYIATSMFKESFAISNNSTEKIKIKSIYGSEFTAHNVLIKRFLPLDACYGKDFQEKITTSIKSQQLDAMKRYEAVAIKWMKMDSPSVFDGNLYLYLIENRSFSEVHKKKVEKDIDDYLEKRKGERICCIAFSVGGRGSPALITSVYALAKACKSQPAIDKLITLARKSLDNPLKNIRLGKKLDSYPDEKVDGRKVSSIIAFACDFDLYEEYKEQLIDLLHRSTNCRRLSDIFDRKSWKNVQDILRILIKLNKVALLLAIESELREMLARYSLFMSAMAGDIDEIFTAYLELANYFQVPLERQKAELKKFFSHCEHQKFSFNYNVPDDLFFYIKKAGWLQDDEIFKYVIYHLKDTKIDPFTYALVRDDGTYMKNVLDLIKHLPKKQLSFKQRKIIREIICEKAQKNKIYFFTNLINKVIFDSAIFLTEEWQQIIIRDCQRFIDDKPDNWSLPLLFAVVEQLQLANVQHRDFPALLEKKNELESGWQSGWMHEKFKITLPLFTPLSNTFITNRADVYSALNAFKDLSVLEKLNLDMLVMLLGEMKAVNTRQSTAEVNCLFVCVEPSFQQWQNLILAVKQQIIKQGKIENVNVDALVADDKIIKAKPRHPNVSVNRPVIPLALRATEERLRLYVKDMEKYRHNFQLKFWVNAKSRAVSSEINYYLAKKMLLDLYTSIENNTPFYIHDRARVMVERATIAKTITKDPSYATARLWGRVSGIVNDAKKEKQTFRSHLA